MTVRKIIKCETCDQYIIIRVLLGHNEHPSYIFDCPNCEEKINLSMNLYPKERRWEFLFTDNCVDVTTEQEIIRGEREGTVINLTAELPIDENLRNKDSMITPFLLLRQSELFEKRNISDQEAKKDIHKNWKCLRRAINQTVKGKENLAKRYIKEYDFLFDNTDTDFDIFSQLHDFLLFFLMPKKYQYIDRALKEICKDQKRFSSEYSKFYDYFIPNLFEPNLIKLVNIIKIYMENFESLFPYLLYIRKEIDIPTDINSSSFDFESLKLFYGQSFELIASLFEFLTIINNIHNGRDFDKLNSINLEKYKSTDKANRHKAFSENSVFSIFSSEFESSIRNASHHNNFELKDNTKIIYMSGKPLKKKEMLTREYLIRCNHLFINLISIFDMFLFTNEFSRNKIRKWAFM